MHKRAQEHFDNAATRYINWFEPKKFNYLELADHGGRCCGLTHLFNFYRDVSEKDINQRLSEQTEDLRNSWEDENEISCPFEGYDHAFEVVLTDHQVIECGKLLKSMGFKWCFRWFNRNSGNYCNLFMYKNYSYEEQEPPFKWDEM